MSKKIDINGGTLTEIILSVIINGFKISFENNSELLTIIISKNYDIEEFKMIPHYIKQQVPLYFINDRIKFIKLLNYMCNSLILTMNTQLEKEEELKQNNYENTTNSIE